MSLPQQKILPRKLFMKTYGCQMNFYDSDRMADVLAPLGYSVTDNVDEADAAILNTCHIREKAEQKMYSDLGRMNIVKKKRQGDGSDLLIVVAGCVGQAQGDNIMQQAPYVSLVVGPQTYHRLPEYMARLHRKEGMLLDTDFPVESKFDHLPEPSLQGAQAFLSIQEGCDKFCHFCVVPYTRGVEYSRSVDAVLREASLLIAKGAIEITLLGQNVNAYHGIGPDGQEWNLGKLLFALAELPGLVRIRYTTSHPRDMHDELLAAHRDLPNVMPFIHLPVQSGSDRILQAMNRKHTIMDYERIIDTYRTARPDIAFSSDFIVGYPGETDDDHKRTLVLIDRVKFAQAYSFSYSARPGTPAAVLSDHVPSEVQSERLHELQDRVHVHQLAFNQSHVGSILPVLVEREGRQEGQVMGKSPWMQSVILNGNLLQDKDRVINVRITQAGPNSIKGEREDVACAC